MNIQPISVQTNFYGKTTTKINSTPEKKESPQKTKLIKAMPYITGLALIAIGALAYRNKLAKISKNKIQEIKNINKASEAEKEIKNETIKETEKNIEEIISEEQPKTIRKANPEISEIEEELQETEKAVFTGFDKSGNPVYETIEMPNPFTPAGSIFKDIKDGIDLNDKEIINKIEGIRQSEQYNIDRIINENTHNGHIDIPMMKKVAGDYMADVNRGETRFHQAADLLEQAHIREYVKGDDKVKTGMFNLTDSVVTDPVLYRAYQNMPIEESASRLNYLRKHDLKSESFKESMTADGFFDKAYQRLVEKYQFKKYNETHGINA